MKFRMEKLRLLPLGLFFATFILGASSHSLNCTNHLEAVEGAAMEVLCQSEVEIDSCAFNFPGFKKIKVYAGVKNQNYEFVGNYEKGECGIRFSAMKRELEGQVTVEVTFPDEDVPAFAEINVTMGYPQELSDTNTSKVNAKDHSLRTIFNIIALFVIVIAVIAVTVWMCLGKARRVTLLGYIRNARDQLWGPPRGGVDPCV